MLNQALASILRRARSIKAIVQVMRPAPKDSICDPACGTGGFLTAAHDYVGQQYAPLSRAQQKSLRNDLVPRLGDRRTTRRGCA